MTREQVGELESLLRLMAGMQVDIEGNPIVVLELDDARKWPWVCLGPVRWSESSESPSTAHSEPSTALAIPDARGQSQRTDYANHPWHDLIPRVLLGHYEVGFLVKRKKWHEPSPAPDRREIPESPGSTPGALAGSGPVSVFVGQCADCGTVYWAYEEDREDRETQKPQSHSSGLLADDQAGDRDNP